MNRIHAFLELLIKQNGTDLHLVSGNVPRIRLLGDIHPVKYRDLSVLETEQLLFDIMSEKTKRQFESAGNVDFAYQLPEVARFRINAFRHLNGIGAVFRAIPNSVPELSDLGLPKTIRTMLRQRKGLILVTGPTGSGKTTTLAAMVNAINKERKGHIVTIEDPIEYIHPNQLCLVSQREIGEHAQSFSEALHSALREDPDVIMVGEMRDLETISLAVTAAEMGILVLATLHTNGAAPTVDRIINAFPPGEAPYIRSMLSTSLVGIISQHLLRTIDGRERLAAAEILINNSATANIIREGKTEQIENVMQGGKLNGMQNLDSVLKRLIDDKLISGDEAYHYARNKSQFESYREQSNENTGVSKTSNDQFVM